MLTNFGPRAADVRLQVTGAWRRMDPLQRKPGPLPRQREQLLPNESVLFIRTDGKRAHSYPGNTEGRTIPMAGQWDLSLPNGNTMITEGSGGRIFEVTTDHEIVWEYISPYFGMDNRGNNVYRAYRVPYDWVPQLDAPVETAVKPVDVSTFRVPGSKYSEDSGIVDVEGTLGYHPSQLCVVQIEEKE